MADSTPPAPAPADAPGIVRRFTRPLRVRDLLFDAAARRHLATTLSPEAAPAEALSVVVSASRVPPSRPNRFAAVTGAPYDGRTLPPTFAPTLFVGATLRLLTDDTFPLSPLGWVQTQQTFREEAVLLSHHPVALILTLQKLTATPQGPEILLEQQLTVDDRAVWTGTATLLRPAVAGVRGPAAGTAAADLPQTHTLAAKGDIGLRYAWATGDAHPHRLTPRTARPLGYADPIAHEPWLLARTHALLADRFPTGARLGGTFAFPVPFVLPGAASLHAGPLGPETGQLEAALQDPRAGGFPLFGTFSVL